MVFLDVEITLWPVWEWKKICYIFVFCLSKLLSCYRAIRKKRCFFSE